MANKRVDCDGHVMEVTDELISSWEPFKTTGHMNPRRVLPSLDRFHTPRLEERKPGTFSVLCPEKWLQFLDKTGLDPACCSLTKDWPTARSRSHLGRSHTPRPTIWLHAKYLRFNSRLKGIALIPCKKFRLRSRNCGAP